MSTVIEGSDASVSATSAGASSRVLANSLSGSIWTAVSRVSGLAETIAVGAVLGATYLGNTFQSINSLPNIVYYQLLAGSLFASLLVPPLVRCLDRGDRAGAERLARGFFGVLLVVGVGFGCILLAAGPLIMRLLTLGVSDPATAEAASRVGMLLLVMFVPQILLYITAGTGGAVMNANGRFALAAGAPALENAGIITVLIVAAVVFGTGVDVGSVSNTELILIGLGTTAAVGLHSGTVWLGARSSGLTLIPRAGWSDPEVRTVVRRIVPTLAYTGLAASQIFAVFVVADRVRGGLVAFQLAMSFFYLPSAIVTWPIARALLPQLVRLHQGDHREAFRAELLRGVHLASFITIPTAIAYAVLAVPMARAITFGQLGTPGGVRMVALSMASLAAAVVGETWFILGTYAYYAQQNVRAPLRSMFLRVAVSFVLMAASWSVHGPAVLPLLGLALSAGSIVGALHMWARLRAHLGQGGSPALRPLARTIAASICMIIPAALTAWACGRLPDTQLTQSLSMLAAAIVGVGTYFFVQGRLRAPELGWLKTALAGLGPVAPTKE